jgi:hypothetical protein
MPLVALTPKAVLLGVVGAVALGSEVTSDDRR